MFEALASKAKKLLLYCVVLAATWLLGNSYTASELGLHHMASNCAYAGMQTHSCKGKQDTRAAEKDISRLLWEYSCISGPVLQLQWNSWEAVVFTGWGYDIPFAVQDETCVLWLQAAGVPDCVAPKVGKGWPSLQQLQ